MSRVAWLMLFMLTMPARPAWAEVDFQRDIRPILSNTCFKCHGPDEETREADLRLDVAEEATVDRGGYRAVQPGDTKASELFVRVTTDDTDLVMPPIDEERRLAAGDIELLRQWIEQGAKYAAHWAFQAVRRPPLPDVSMAARVENPIDAFVVAKLEAAGITPSEPADRYTLARRVYLDLLGLPPTAAAADAFVDDARPDAYERLVAQLLASPHHGERWGRHWLDQARYADTNGYTIDSPRSIWPYRDWVISAINRDQPFDQFTIEQLAGDLLPEPTQEQLVATGFHRNTLVNQEGGADAEQFRNEVVVDRVNTTGSVWLGLTVGCAQCHNHKYDPLSNREYYQLFAFFNSGSDVNSVSPTLSVATAEQRRRLGHWDDEIRVARQALEENIGRFRSSATDAAHAKLGLPDSERKLLENALKKIEAERKRFASGIPSTMVMRELSAPRPAHVLVRGDFLRRGEPVEPRPPSFLPDMKSQAQNRTRLDLARWLTNPNNPLTARVTVNRIWMRYFGRGLVETENDFGFQGTLPTHPQLLDWLAAEFVDSGWSLKHIHRLIVTSATYCQSSHARPDLTEKDPLNKLLARQVRLRVEAETVRDVGLAATGLLVNRLGGPSVYPPQPDGVYAFTQRKAAWPTEQGADRYRRGMYTFFMRSAPHPQFDTFDAPKFNTTCTRRARSNTPLQALAMANDEAAFEMARALARRVVVAPDDSDEARLHLMFRRCLTRPPESNEVQRLLAFLELQRQGLSDSPSAAEQLAGGPLPPQVGPIEMAAWTAAARVVLNLDEFVTRE